MDEQNKGQEEGKMDEVSTSEVSGGNYEEKSMGGAIGAIIIVAILVIGGIYFINRDGGDAVVAETPVVSELSLEEIVALPDETAAALEVQSASDEVVSIEEDLALDLGNLEEGLGDIDAELAL